MRILKTSSDTSAQHALGQWSLTSRARKYKVCTGGNTTRFLGRWLVGSPHRNTVARVFPGRGKIVKYWPVGGYKRFGDHYLNVYLSKNYCTYKRLFGTLIAFSVKCSLWKIGLICLDLLQTFCELMIKGDFKLWWFPERLRSSTNKNSHFLDVENFISFVWYTQRLSQRSWVFLISEEFLATPFLTAPPKHSATGKTNPSREQKNAAVFANRTSWRKIAITSLTEVRSKQNKCTSRKKKSLLRMV